MYAVADEVEDLGNGWTLKTYRNRVQRYALWYRFKKGSRFEERVILYTDDIEEVGRRVSRGPAQKWGSDSE